MRYRCLLIAALLMIAVVAARPASATPAFATVFKKEYVDGLEDKKFAEEVSKGTNKCFACHQGKKSKKNRNAFGLELSKLIKKDQKDPEKISAAIKKAFAMHVDPKDDKSETYLDRWKANKWPAGKLEDLMKEPATPADEKK
jgi:hypothetical protein